MNSEESQMTMPGAEQHPITLPEVLERAVSSGVSADALEKIVGLIQSQEDREAKRLFYDAMARCQAEMPTVVKDAENKQTNSMYAKLETVAKKIRPIWLRHGFSISFSEVAPITEGNIRLKATLRHSGGHSETHEMEAPTDEKGIKGNVNKTPIHGRMSAIAYIERNLKTRVFDIVIGDTDTDAAGLQDTIGAKDIETLKKAIVDAGKDEAAFMKWAKETAGVESFEQISVRLYARMMTMLSNTKKKEKADDDDESRTENP